MPVPKSPLRTITQDEIDAFWRDGVVCLRGVIPQGWLDITGEAVEEWLHSPQCLDYTAYGTDVAQAAGAEVLVDAGTRRGRFYSGIDHWTTRPAFRALATHSPLVEIAARLLKSRKVNLYEDSILVKEPGTLEKTAFHQDIAYFHAEGHQICTTWMPLDPVTIETGALKFIRGSHLWKAQYRPNFFITELPMPDTEGEAVPDFHKDRRTHEMLSFVTAPGDITVHHARTIHGADGNASTDIRRRAVSIRYCGDDVRYRFRKGVPRKPHHDQMAEGDVMDHPDCPVVWPRVDRTDEA
jgi:ectoine hydroxylase-related dioxygenase (phytanoyl-CoA dioxygenase family)